MMALLLLLLLSAPAAAPAAAHGRTTRTLTRGWRFERGDLPFNGGPKLCVDDISTAFPIDLTGKQCAMGPRDAWSRITAGGDTNLPSDCARACCSSDNCTMWTYFNGTNGPQALGGPGGGPGGRGPGAFRVKDACVLGYGPHDTATDCVAEGGTDWLGGARTLPVAPGPPPPPVANGAEAEGFDDSRWRRLSIPHDFVIEGEPCVAALGCENPLSNFMHGSYPKGVGWYRHTFAAPDGGSTDRVTWLHFEGVLNDAMVFVNGKFLARRFESYSGFSVEIPAGTLKATNTLAVRCDSRVNEGWFYEGGGLHRPVYLISTGSLRVAEHGVYVMSTPQGSLRGATVAPTDIEVSTEVINSGGATSASSGSTMMLQQDVIDASTQEVVQTETLSFSVDAGANQTLTQVMHLPSAKLWSLDTPHLYILRTKLLDEDKAAVDELNVTFGVRRAVFDVNNGFALNDEKIQIKGFCMHETFGGTGSAIPPTVNDFRIAKLKEMGTNAWRGAHEPVAESLLDSADRLGMLMWVENREFGQEVDGFTPEDVITANIAAMVKRSRNHPSIIVWSLCNEGGCIQRSDEQAVRKGNAAKAVIHALDPTRPMTAAINFGAQVKVCEWDCLSPTLDVVGMNYNWDDWDAFHANNTNQPMVSSELTRGNSVRGIYTPSPKTAPWDKTKGYSDVYTAAPGYVNSWRQINSRRDWLAGGWLWTGMDYLGEPDSPVSISSSFGAVDIAGFDKDSAAFFKANWTAGAQIHIVPSHWNFDQGSFVLVWVFANNEVDSVALSLNGSPIGEPQPVNDTGWYHTEWNISYAAGELSATGYSKDGKTIVASDTRETASAVASLNLTVDYVSASGLSADGSDVFMARVAVVDAKGRLVVDSDQVNVSFAVSQADAAVPLGTTGAIAEEGGAAEGVEEQGPRIFGVANGDPSCYESDKASWRTTFGGLARAIVQSGTTPGKVTLTASADGLGSAQVSVDAH